MAEIESQLRDHEPDLKQSMVIQGAARYLTWDFTQMDIPNLEILEITDIQFGHRQCNETKLKEYLDWVMSEPNRYIFLGGDLVDAGHRDSKGSPFEQIGDPQDEVWRFCRLLAPYRHRILGYVGGNHERRGEKTFGDLGVTISTILHLPYSPGKQHYDILFGAHAPFKATGFHGGGSGRTKGSIANTIHRLMSQSDSQYYFTGHLHQSMVLTDWRERRNGRGQMETVKVIGAMGSSFLNHYGTYAEVIMGSNPQGIMMPRAILEKNGSWEVTLK